MKMYLLFMVFIFVGALTPQETAIKDLTTTTSAPEPSSSNDTEPIVPEICGEDITWTNCHCYSETAYCYNYARNYPSFTRVQLNSPNFVVKAFFPKQISVSDYSFETIKKGDVFPAYVNTTEHLVLNRCGIKVIGNGTFDDFAILKELYLSENLLTNLTSGVLSEKVGAKLEILALNGMSLDILSIDFGHLIHLKNLHLDRNSKMASILSSNSSYIFPKSLSNLKLLSLQYCRISEIKGSAFVNLVDLETLLLSGNLFTSYPKSLNSLTSLRHLNLGSTQIENLNQTSLGENSNLNELIITQSKITKLDDCAFCGFSNLTNLNLFNNRPLSFIHENAFGYAYNGTSPKIEKFSVENCNLTSIPEKLLNWQSVKEIGIGENPFNCNCSMAWIIKDILNPTFSGNFKSMGDGYYYRYHEDLQCASPFIFKGQKFHELKKDVCPAAKKPVPESHGFRTAGLLILVMLVLAAIGIPLGQYLRQKKNANSFVHNYEENNFVNPEFDDNA